MSLANIDKIEIIKAKSGDSIAVVNGVYLHSNYDPVKEAEQFVQTHQKVLDEKRHILLLGLGLGHHLRALISYMENRYHNSYHITVIDPVEEIYQEFLKLFEFKSLNVTFYCGLKIQDLYQNTDLLDTLLKRPGIIAHSPSFSLHKDYFSKFLSYKAPNTIGEFSSLFKYPEFAEYFTEENQNLDLKTWLQSFKKEPTRKTYNSLDYLMMAYGELIKQENPKNNRP